ncbi:MAG: hypothetical protein RL076_2370 [Chloroflexota bacterium]|jgi:hypothetical protein
MRPVLRQSWFARALVYVSVADVLLHALTQQFEITRAIAALLLVLWVEAWRSHRWVGWLVVSFYLVVNAWFVLDAGIVNPSTATLRLPWLIIVVVSLVLSIVVLFQQHRGQR